jgi:hypothetical protein
VEADLDDGYGADEEACGEWHREFDGKELQQQGRLEQEYDD